MVSRRLDAVVIGAGAAGLYCAGIAGQLGARVLLVDHATKLAEKIRISGGGRCNFTNRETDPGRFFSRNPHFCRSALARHGAADFLALVRRHRIAFHEKHRGQLFCDDSSERIIEMLRREAGAGRVELWQGCAVHGVRRTGDAGFAVETANGPVETARVVIATGGLSIPKLGATDFGYRVAKQFGHRLVETRPALVPLTFAAERWAPYAALAGVSVPARVTVGSGRERSTFDEDLLFTHRGLSGPAILQISTPWQPGEALQIDLAAGRDLDSALRATKRGSGRQLGTELARLLPARLAERWLDGTPGLASRPIAEMPDRELQAVAQGLQGWTLLPDGTEGYRKAEVTAGGVDTRELSSQSMESRLQPGLHFIGEVVDVTGWLGGYNFQWAWASGAACASALAPG